MDLRCRRIHYIIHPKYLQSSDISVIIDLDLGSDYCNGLAYISCKQFMEALKIKKPSFKGWKSLFDVTPI